MEGVFGLSVSVKEQSRKPTIRATAPVVTRKAETADRSAHPITRFAEQLCSAGLQFSLMSFQETIRMMQSKHLLLVNEQKEPESFEFLNYAKSISYEVFFIFNKTHGSTSTFVTVPVRPIRVSYRFVDFVDRGVSCMRNGVLRLYLLKSNLSNILPFLALAFNPYLDYDAN